MSQPTMSKEEYEERRAETRTVMTPILKRFPPKWMREIEVARGWHPIVLALNEQIAALYPDYEVHQVKEKLGDLCYFTSLDSDETVRRLIQAAESKAAVTCEFCGQPGHKTSPRGWIKTLCDSCEADEKDR